MYIAKLPFSVLIKVFINTMNINKDMLFEVTEEHLQLKSNPETTKKKLLFCNKLMENISKIFDKPNISYKDLWKKLSCLVVFLDSNLEENQEILRIHKYLDSKAIWNYDCGGNNNTVWAYNGSTNSSSSSSSSSSSMACSSRTTTSWKSPNCGLTR